MERRQQNWQKTKRIQGLCSVCGKYSLSKRSTWYCDICLAKRRVKAAVRREKKKNDLLHKI